MVPSARIFGDVSSTVWVSYWSCRCFSSILHQYGAFWGRRVILIPKFARYGSMPGANNSLVSWLCYNQVCTAFVEGNQKTLDLLREGWVVRFGPALVAGGSVEVETYKRGNWVRFRYYQWYSRVKYAMIREGAPPRDRFCLKKSSFGRGNSSYLARSVKCIDTLPSMHVGLWGTVSPVFKIRSAKPRSVPVKKTCGEAFPEKPCIYW